MYHAQRRNRLRTNLFAHRAKPFRFLPSCPYPNRPANRPGQNQTARHDDSNSCRKRHQTRTPAKRGRKTTRHLHQQNSDSHLNPNRRQRKRIPCAERSRRPTKYRNGLESPKPNHPAPERAKHGPHHIPNPKKRTWNGRISRLSSKIYNPGPLFLHFAGRKVIRLTTI